MDVDKGFGAPCGSERSKTTARAPAQSQIFSLILINFQANLE